MSKPVSLNSVIIRFGGELWLKKAWTKRRYMRCLVGNIKQVLKRHDIQCDEVVRKHGRLYLRTRKATEAADQMSRVFGISSVSPALEIGSNRFERVVDKSVSLASHTLSKGDSFAVRCRRVGEHPYSSRDVCMEIGRQVLEKHGETRDLTVDLKHPDRVLGVEVRDNEAFVFGNVFPGVGGMPLGTQGRVVCMLGGSIDSTVAGWLAMKRGCPLVSLHFDCASMADETATKSVVDMTKVLLDWSVGFPRRLRVVPFGHVLTAIVENHRPHLTYLLCKRMMYRVAESLADQVGADGIVTGEKIGEGASQTLWNLRALGMAIKKYPIHRPLVGFDRAEIEGLARKIGAYETSIQNVHGWGAIPHKHVAKAKLEEIEEAEVELNIDEMTKRCLDELRVADL